MQISDLTFDRILSDMERGWDDMDVDTLRSELTIIGISMDDYGTLISNMNKDRLISLLSNDYSNTLMAMTEQDAQDVYANRLARWE